MRFRRRETRAKSVIFDIHCDCLFYVSIRRSDRFGLVVVALLLDGLQGCCRVDEHQQWPKQGCGHDTDPKACLYLFRWAQNRALQVE